MEVKAKARYVRMSPRKVRLVINVVRGMNVKEAQTQLQFMKKAAAEPVLKLLNSAIANAEHNFELSKDGLRIKSITADGGPTLGRWRARAFGKAAPIRKRTSHISIILEDREKKVVEKTTKETLKNEVEETSKTK
jgi:large subunit ribosomal protein L22